MRIGLFGGTFDPVHLGHLILAERCREDAGLDEVWFLPSYQPPHKRDRAVTRYEYRCEMTALAVAGQSAFRVEPVEKELPPPSYTANTLAELRSRHPDHTFHLIIGADTLADLPTWYEPRRVLEQAGLVVVDRPGSEPADAALGKLVRLHQLQPFSIQIVHCPLIDIASREVRGRVAAGRTIRFLVPRSVEEYIRERKLYRDQ